MFHELRNWTGDVLGRLLTIRLGYSLGATHHTGHHAVVQMINDHFNAMTVASGRAPDGMNNWNNPYWVVEITIIGHLPAEARRFHFQWREVGTTSYVEVYHIEFAQTKYRDEAKKALMDRGKKVLGMK